MIWIKKPWYLHFTSKRPSEAVPSPPKSDGPNPQRRPTQMEPMQSPQHSAGRPLGVPVPEGAETEGKIRSIFLPAIFLVFSVHLKIPGF